MVKEFLDFINSLMDLYSTTIRMGFTAIRRRGTKRLGRFPPPTTIEIYLVISLLVYEIPPRLISKQLGYVFHREPTGYVSGRVKEVIKYTLKDQRASSHFLVYENGEYICVFCGVSDKDLSKMTHHIKEHIITAVLKYSHMRDVLYKPSIF